VENEAHRGKKNMGDVKREQGGPGRNCLKKRNHLRGRGDQSGGKKFSLQRSVLVCWRMHWLGRKNCYRRLQLGVRLR